MGKTILEEAVEDVQALRKAAEESAKTMFIESMSPRIEKFIQSHLGQEAVDVPGGVPGDAAPVGGGEKGEVPSHPDMQSDDDGRPYDDESDHEEGEEEVELELEPDESDELEGHEDHEREGFESDDEESESSEEDDEDQPHQEGYLKHNQAVDPNPDEDDDAGPRKGSKWKKKMKKGMDCDESVELTSEDLQKAFIDVLKSGLKEDSTMGRFSDPQDPNDGEYGLVHKVPGEVQWADGARVLKKSKNAKMVTKEAHDKVVKQLYRQLALHQEALKYYKKNLNEMNVFNAKLVYTTRLLQNNLSNKQKLNVVEAIDKARTKQQVELVYRTLSESFKIAGVMNESRNKVKGPKASRFTKPGSTLTEAKTQETAQSNRWAELAGLTE